MNSPFEGQEPYVDHIAIAVGKGNLDALRTLFVRVFGGKIIYDPGVIGDGITGMRTFVVAIGSVKFALMEGVDGSGLKRRSVRTTSQISRYEDGKGGGPRVQHIAVSVRDVRKLAEELQKRGVRFLTENDDGTPKYLVSEDEGGGTVIQVFTYPFVNGLFFEFKQKIPDGASVPFAEFRDKNVKDLWYYVERTLMKVGEDVFFTRLNIFGELVHTEHSLWKRGHME